MLNKYEYICRAINYKLLHIGHICTLLFNIYSTRIGSSVNFMYHGDYFSYIESMT